MLKPGVLKPGYLFFGDNMDTAEEQSNKEEGKGKQRNEHGSRVILKQVQSGVLPSIVMPITALQPCTSAPPHGDQADVPVIHEQQSSRGTKDGNVLQKDSTIYPKVGKVYTSKVDIQSYFETQSWATRRFVKSVTSNVFCLSLRCRDESCGFKVNASNPDLRRKLEVGAMSPHKIRAAALAGENGRASGQVTGGWKLTRVEPHTCTVECPKHQRIVKKVCPWGKYPAGKPYVIAPMRADILGQLLRNYINVKGGTVLRDLTYESARSFAEKHFHSRGKVGDPGFPVSKRLLKKSLILAIEKDVGTPLQALTGLDFLKRDFEVNGSGNEFDLDWKDTAEGTSQLQRIRFCFGGTKDGYHLLRHMLFLDATFLTGEFHGSTIYCDRS